MRRESVAVAALTLACAALFGADSARNETLVLGFGEPWCVAGAGVRKTCESQTFATALGGRFRLVPEDKAEGLSFETWRYPAIFLFDANKRLLARFESLPQDISADVLAARIRAASESAADAVALLDRKAYGRGFEALRKLNPELFRYDGKNKEWTAAGFENEFKAMCAADPKDSAGYLAAFTAGDGYGWVSAASSKAGTSEGAEHIKSLRAQNTARLSVEQKQSIDMAEFAFLRKDDRARERCRNLLRAVVAADATTYWAWAAHGYLREMGEDVELPNDPAARVPHGRGIVDHALVKSAKTAPDAEGLRRTFGADDGSDDAIRRVWARTTIGARTFTEVASVDGGMAFVRQFLASREWMDDFLFSGPIAEASRAFRLLAVLVRNDADGWSQEEVGRRVATAIALNADEKMTDEKAVRLFLAYRHLAKGGRLHRFAYVQDTHAWRFVIGRGHDAADILFAADFLNMPTERYDNACWEVPYRRENCFGESIHGRNFFRPWDGADWPSLRICQRTGAVCGGLSDFGATAANAHGIPSVTSAQPGHCAYVLRREDTGRWTIGYNISRFTQPHYSFYGGGFTELDVLERGYADRKAQVAADLLVARAKVAETRQAGSVEIERLYRAAARACRCHVGVWLAYADWLGRTGADESQTRIFMRAVARALPDGRQLTWNIENDCLKRIARLPNGAERAATALEELYPMLPQPTGTPTSEECDWRGVLNVHGEMVGAGNYARLMTAALRANLGRGDYFAATLGWGSDVLLPRAGGEEEFLAVMKAVEPQAGGTGRIELREAIRNASRAGSLGVFRALVDLNDRLNPPDRSLKGYSTTDFGGELLSAKGMLLLSSSGRWDRPELYGRVIDTTGFGGKNTQLFITGVERSPWVSVELPGPTDVKGIRLVNRFASSDLAAHQVPFKIAVSEDGRDWTDVAAENEVRDEYAIPISRASHIRFVKVYRPENAGKAEGLHFQKVLVYGKRLY